MMPAESSLGFELVIVSLQCDPFGHIHVIEDGAQSIDTKLRVVLRGMGDGESVDR